MTAPRAIALPPVPRATAARLAIGSLAACAVVALVDPGQPGRYPPCPTSALLGFDCPACGGLRGVHALSRGQIGTALDHNLLLVAIVPLGLVMWWGWVRAAAGSPTPSRAIPRWVATVGIVLAVAFTVARNLPWTAVEWLGSTA